MNEAAEPVPSQWPNGRAGARRSATCGRVLVERSVRAVSVEMVDVLAQHCGEVPWSGDQEAVEAFAPKRADPAFGDRVRLRRSEWCADDADVRAGEHRVEGGGEFAVPVADQETELKRRGRRGP